VVARSIGQMMCTSLYPFPGIDVMIFPLAHGLGSRAFVGPEVEADTKCPTPYLRAATSISHSEPLC
jgi:hypothetical protein